MPLIRSARARRRGAARARDRAARPRQRPAARRRGRGSSATRARRRRRCRRRARRAAGSRRRGRTLARRHREDGRPELVDELRLDLALRVARSDPRADARLHPPRDRCVRGVERRLADGADELGLELGGRRLQLAAPLRAPQERAQRPAASDEPHQAGAERPLDPFVEVGGFFDRRPRSASEPCPWRRRRTSPGSAGRAVAADGRALAVVDVRVGDAEALEELARVTAEVLHIDADEDDVPVLPALRAFLKQRHLVPARTAPGRPEVEHDRLAAQRLDREVTLAVQPLERESGRRRGPTAGKLRRDRALVLNHLPDQQAQQRRDDRDRGDLAAQAQLRDHLTM